MASAKLVAVLLAAFCVVATHASSGAAWNYDDTTAEGPSHWYAHYPTCGATSQSPIDITLAANLPADMSSIVFTGYDTVLPNSFTLTNNGHSAQVSINSNAVSFTGGNFNGKYVLEQFHYHWGTQDLVGSEHLVDGLPHSMEIHFVHYNSDKYTSVSDASAHTDDPTALAVLGVFAEVTTDPAQVPAALSEVVSHLPEEPYEGDQSLIEPFAVSTIMPCDRSAVRYNGSLTTPGCAQVVSWNVFTTPIRITPDQLASFRTLHSNVVGEPEEFLTHNYRPAQPLNGRTVYKYVDPAPTC